MNKNLIYTLVILIPITIISFYFKGTNFIMQKNQQNAKLIISRFAKMSMFYTVLSIYIDKLSIKIKILIYFFRSGVYEQCKKHTLQGC